ncbi:Salicylate biosynthesis protein PchB [Rhodobacteraceae bacterium THAF1]|uniref:chorismate mutase n=1 Tax=Palleronia sp. THAF1 TaxID=2587842 RepID=UPI000F3AB96C|nr:chorismate mutase [Palleronia sp. THAF1]QFU08922.1 Salicylate biosynthesis protein PchB [Palleronia sp. THAF1]VDC24362.1 Salicylate biosynthesis protein PchB [Rhodobacteraceae bacterium THAF1]
MSDRRTAKECSNMSELRAAIDSIDRDLIELLAERVGYIDRAAQLKPAEGLPARTTDRIAAVVANVRALAEDKDLDPDLAEQIWRLFIEWAIVREEKVLGPSVEE